MLNIFYLVLRDTKFIYIFINCFVLIIFIFILEKTSKSKYEVKAMLSNLVDIPSSADNICTSFPFMSQINCFEKEWRMLHMFKETKEIDFTFLKKDFSSYSLSFNPLQYNFENEELNYLLMTSLYLPEKSLNYSRHYGKSYETYHEIIRTASKYWFLNAEFKYKASDLSSDWQNKVPASFKWLISFISKYSYINCSELYRIVIQIEKLLFLQKKRIHAHKLSDFKNKINVDF